MPKGWAGVGVRDEGALMLGWAWVASKATPAQPLTTKTLAIHAP